MADTNKDIRVRFAPSPTGYLHVGGARTALYDYLFAKNKKGTFVLRVEDTDQERSTEESMRKQIQDLKWLGLDWDEGVDPETLEDIGSYGPYRQSQRLHIYQEQAEKLLSQGDAYYCFLTDAEIEEQKKNSDSFAHVQSPYRDMSLEEAKKKIAGGEAAVVRFKTPKETKEYKINDLVRGEVKWPSDMVGDFVLLRSGGMPVYNFCCVVDDALMKISHVFRAEEHLNNTLRQIMIYEALGFEVPEFAHVSIILGEDKQKLSKRHGATSINQYKEMGFLPHAMNNYLALLGWSSPTGEEILSQEDMITHFGFERFNSSPAVFDETKLKWVNATHLRDLPGEELWSLLSPGFQEAGISLPESKEWQSKALELFKSYMETLTDAVELFRPLSLGEMVFTDEGKDCLSWETSHSVVGKWKELLSALPDDSVSEEQFKEIQNTVKTECGVKGKNLFMPIRAAVIGKPHGAELQVLIPLLGKKVLVERAEKALELTKG